MNTTFGTINTSMTEVLKNEHPLQLAVTLLKILATAKQTFMSLMLLTFVCILSEDVAVKGQIADSFITCHLLRNVKEYKQLKISMAEQDMQITETI